MLYSTKLQYDKLKRTFAIIELFDEISYNDDSEQEIRKFLVEIFEDTAADLVEYLKDEIDI